MADKQGNGQGLPRYYFDLTALNAAMAGSFAEVVVPQGNVPAGSTDSGNPLKMGGKYNSTLPTYTDGQRTDVQTDNRGNLRVALVAQVGSASDALSNGLAFMTANTLGIGADVNRALAIASHVFNGTSWDRAAKANGTSRIPSAAASTNPTSAKASAGTVYTIEAMNTTATVKYLKLYNKATAPTVGTDTPVRTIALPPSNARMFIEFPTGLYFSTGIAYGMSGAAADADATALAAGDVVGVNIDYS